MGVDQRAQIVMSDSDIIELLQRSRIATMATIGPSGTPHLITMWYALLDSEPESAGPGRALPELWFETKAKSQKAVNLRRDPRITCMIEAGQTYDQLRGVSIEGYAEIVDEPAKLFAVGVSVWERYTGPYSEEVRPLVEQMLNKRVAIRVVPQRVRSWDHRKLGLPTLPPSGSTAQPSTGPTYRYRAAKYD